MKLDACAGRLRPKATMIELLRVKVDHPVGRKDNNWVFCKEGDLVIRVGNKHWWSRELKHVAFSYLTGLAAGMTTSDPIPRHKFEEEPVPWTWADLPTPSPDIEFEEGKKEFAQTFFDCLEQAADDHEVVLFGIIVDSTSEGAASARFVENTWQNLGLGSSNKHLIGLIRDNEALQVFHYQPDQNTDQNPATAFQAITMSNKQALIHGRKRA